MSLIDPYDPDRSKKNARKKAQRERLAKLQAEREDILRKSRKEKEDPDGES